MRERVGLSGFHEPGKIVALCSSLAGKNGQFQQELCDVLVDIIERLQGSRYSLHTCCWLAHISSHLGFSDHFSVVAEAISDFGGVSVDRLICPAPTLTLEESEAELYELHPQELGPPISEFRSTVRRSTRPVNKELMAVRALIDDSYPFAWAEDLISALCG